MSNKYCNLDATKKIKDEYTKINTGFDDVETDITALENEVTQIVLGDANAEVGSAHISAAKDKTFVTIGERFEEIEEEFIAHESENIASLALKADVTYVDSSISSIGDGSPKGTPATLLELQTEYPTGTAGIFVVVEDGHWYYWNGSAWTDGGVYQNSVIADASILLSKLSTVSKIGIITGSVLLNILTNTITVKAGTQYIKYNDVGTISFNHLTLNPYTSDRVHTTNVALSSTSLVYVVLVDKSDLSFISVTSSVFVAGIDTYRDTHYLYCIYHNNQIVFGEVGVSSHTSIVGVKTYKESVLLADSIHGDKITSGTIPNSKIESESIENDRIKDGTIESDKLSELRKIGIVTGSVEINVVNGTITAKAGVQSIKYNDNGTVIYGHLTDSPYTSDKIYSGFTFSGVMAILVHNTTKEFIAISTTVLNSGYLATYRPSYSLFGIFYSNRLVMAHYNSALYTKIITSTYTYNECQLLINSVHGDKITSNTISSSKLLDNSVAFGKIDTKLTFYNDARYEVVVGKEFNIYFDSIIDSAIQSLVYFKVTTPTITYPQIKHFDECIRINALSDKIGVHVITVQVLKLSTSEVLGTITFEINVIADVTLVTPVKALFIGDSLTANGNIQNTVKDLFGANFSLYGTLGSNPYKHEGRSSWSLTHYTTLASKDGVSNPFWNPGTSLFDFSYYVTNNPSFSDVDIVNIFLGRNDAYNVSAASRVETIVNSIKAYNANIKVTIMSAYHTASTNAGTGQYMQNTWSYRLSTFIWNAQMKTLFSSRVSEDIYLIPQQVNLDTYYDYPHSNVQVSARNTETVYRVTDNVHPNTFGYLKFADVYYSYLQSIINS